MKKTLLSLGAIALFATANAQEPNNLTKLDPVSLAEATAAKSQTQNESWYDYTTVLDLLGDMQYFVGSMFPDTNVYFQGGDGSLYRPFTHATGQLVDPSSLNYAGLVGNTVAWNAGVEGVIDSIAIPYRYTHFEGTNDDTLLVQIVKSTSMTTWDQSDEACASPVFDYGTKAAANAVWETKRVLTEADSTSTFRNLEFEINEPLADGEFFGIYFTYLSGNAYSADDTVGVANTSTKINNFSFLVGYDNSKTAGGNYNYSSNVISEAYFDEAHGWGGYYYPGLLYNDIYQHMVAIAKLRTTTLSTDEVAESNLNVFPNPASDVININADQARVNIYAVTGELVMSEQVANNSLNIANLTAGVYMIEVITENSKLTKRLVVTK